MNKKEVANRFPDIPKFANKVREVFGKDAIVSGEVVLLKDVKPNPKEVVFTENYINWLEWNNEKR